MSKKYQELLPHPLGAIFPPCSEEDYKLLCQSIKQGGLKDDIVLLDGKILDGNNRFTACQKVKAEPRFRNFGSRTTDGTDPFSFVIAENLARRNLTPSQSAALGAELAEKIKEADKAEKQALREARKGSKTAPGKKNGAAQPKGRATAKAAKIVNTSERNVAKAKALKKEDPAAFEEVKQGKTKLHTAAVKTEEKKSAAQRKTEEFAAAKEIVSRVCGEDFALVAEKKLQSKEVLKLSGLEAEEMRRVQPFIEAGWKLNAALGFKAHTLTLAHNLRQLIDRTIAQGGKYDLTVEAYGKSYEVSVKEL